MRAVVSQKEKGKSARTRAYAGFALRLTFGAAVALFVLCRFDYHTILQILTREHLQFFAAAVGLFVAVQVLSAFRWQLVAHLNGIGGRFAEYLKYYFIGMFTNIFCPGLIGGDAIRAYYLASGRNRTGDAIASVMADRGVGLLGLFLLAASAFAMSGLHLPRAAALVIFGLAFGSLLLFLALPLLARSSELLPSPMARAVGPLLSYARQPFYLLPAVVLSMILQGMLAGCQYLLALGLGLGISFTTMMSVVPIGNLITTLPMTFNGLGLRDATYVVLFGSAGVRHADALALSLLWFAATLLGNLSGVLGFIAVASDVRRLGDVLSGATTPINTAQEPVRSLS